MTISNEQKAINMIKYKVLADFLNLKITELSATQCADIEQEQQRLSEEIGDNSKVGMSLLVHVDGENFRFDVG